MAKYSVTSTRKIISGLVLLVVGIVITVVKGDVPDNMLSLMQALYTAFVVGNGLEHISNMVVNKNKDKEESK